MGTRRNVNYGGRIYPNAAHLTLLGGREKDRTRLPEQGQRENECHRGLFEKIQLNEILTTGYSSFLLLISPLGCLSIPSCE